MSINRSLVESLDHESLGWKCIEPIMLQIRGKNQTVKNNMYQTLSVGQRSLFMFRAFYDHSHTSAEEFSWWSVYIWSQPNMWKELLKGLQFFEDHEMIHELNRIENFFVNYRIPRGEREGISSSTIHSFIKDDNFQSTMTQFYQLFKTLNVRSHEKIAAYIRANPEEFLQIIKYPFVQH